MGEAVATPPPTAGPPRGPGAGSVGCACPRLCHPAAAGGACGLPALQTHPTGATGARAPKDSPSLSSLSWIEACPGTARRDVMGHLFCQLWRAASFLRSHLPFPGPAGIPDESPHRPLDLSNLSPQSLAPFHLFTSAPGTRIPEGSLAEVVTAPGLSVSATSPSRVTPCFPAMSVLLWAQDPARALSHPAPGALRRSQRRRGHCPPQSRPFSSPVDTHAPAVVRSYFGGNHKSVWEAD